MTVELLDLSSVRRLLCSWLVVVGEFGWTVMLSTAISLSSYIEVQKNYNSRHWSLMRHFTTIYLFFFVLGKRFSS